MSHFPDRLNARWSIIVVLALLACCTCSFASEHVAAELAERATVAIRAGDLTSGISLLQEAIESDKNRERLETIGAGTTLTPSALAHGREQFQQMARDRPKLLERSGTDGFDVLTDWVTTRLAGQGYKFVVYWDNTRPSDQEFGHVADSRPPYGNERAIIRISDVYPSGPQAGQQLTSEKLWVALVYELLNLSNAEGFQRAYYRTLEGKLSRTDFVTEFFRLEHRAVQLTQEFYATVYLPWAQTSQAKTDPTQWYVSSSFWWQAADETLDGFAFDSGYPWGDYGTQFDRVRRQASALPRMSALQDGSLRPSQHASQAVTALHRGDNEAGLSHLLEGIALRRKRSGREEFESTPPVVSASALSHGQQQFERLSADRPVFLQHSGKDGFDRLRDWAVHRFAGNGTDMMVNWDDAEPVTVALGHIAEHTVSDGRTRGSLRIARIHRTGTSTGQPLSFDAAWSSLVFELLNLSNVSEFNRLERSVLHGRLSRADYVTEMFKLEYRAVELTQEFYANHFLPWTIRAGIPSSPESWYLTGDVWWTSAEEALDLYPFSRSYPWGYYGRVFDSIRNSPGAHPRNSSQKRGVATIGANPLSRGD